MYLFLGALHKQKKYIVFVLIGAIFCSFNSYAIGLSAFRIYLDKQKNQQEFIVYNRDAVTQACTIVTRHFKFDKFGVGTEYKKEGLPEHAADKLFRYSPKTFNVAPGEPQIVRFKYRRKPNVVAQEYRSYIAVACTNELTEEERSQYKSNVFVKPVLRSNIPVIVRTGKIDVELFFNDIEENGNVVSFTINKNGKRSAYGDIFLVDTRNGEIVAKTNKTSMHIETEQKSYTLPLKNIDSKYLSLRFVENKLLSGDKVVEYPLSRVNEKRLALN